MRYGGCGGLFFLLFLLAAAGCRQEERKAAVEGKVAATAAYEQYFGAAPVPAEGECYAVVGYLPRKGNPAQATPVPLFLFTRERQEELVIRHLIGLPADVLPADVDNPFPAGTTLARFSRQGGVAEVVLAFPREVPREPFRIQGIASALGQTLAQFGIETVRVAAGGKILPGLPPEGFRPEPGSILEPDRPRLIGVSGTWEKGRHDPEEVLVLFDRPVQVKDIRLSTEGGDPLPGETFQSMFDMAVILRPAKPEAISAGMPVRVAWEVTDRTGRAGRGDQVFPLKRQEH